MAKLGSSKTPETLYRNTDRQHGILKPNSVNAVRLKKSIVLEMIVLVIMITRVMMRKGKSKKKTLKKTQK